MIRTGTGRYRVRLEQLGQLRQTTSCWRYDTLRRGDNLSSPDRIIDSSPRTGRDISLPRLVGRLHQGLIRCLAMGIVVQPVGSPHRCEIGARGSLLATWTRFFRAWLGPGTLRLWARLWRCVATGDTGVQVSRVYPYRTGIRHLRLGVSLGYAVFWSVLRLAVRAGAAHSRRDQVCCELAVSPGNRGPTLCGAARSRTLQEGPSWCCPHSRGCGWCSSTESSGHRARACYTIGEGLPYFGRTCLAPVIPSPALYSSC